MGTYKAVHPLSPLARTLPALLRGLVVTSIMPAKGRKTVVSLMSSECSGYGAFCKDMVLLKSLVYETIFDRREERLYIC